VSRIKSYTEYIGKNHSDQQKESVKYRMLTSTCKKSIAANDSHEDTEKAKGCVQEFVHFLVRCPS